MFRIADKNDVSILAHLDGEIFTDPWNFSQWEQHMANAAARTIFDSERFSFLACLQIGDEVEILKIGVMQSLRRKGRGRELLSYCEEYLKQQGVSQVFLEVSEKNLSAHSFYVKSGFVETARRKHYYADGSNAIVMVKKY